MKILFILALLSTVYGWVRFSEYKTMCNGKPGQCYTLWNDTDLSQPPANLDYSKIERWGARIWPFKQDMERNIGWAESLAMSMTYNYWINYWKLTRKTRTEVFKVPSIVKAVLEEPVVNCTSPLNLPLQLTTYQHMPFYSTPDYTKKIYFDESFVWDEFRPETWCDYKALSAIPTANLESHTFSTYTATSVSKFTFSTWKSMFRAYGIPFMTVPNDKTFAMDMGYYDDGVYRMYSDIAYYYPANIVGIWMPGNGTTYALCYMFGAFNQFTNYLWVDLKLNSKNPYVIFLGTIK